MRATSRTQDLSVGRPQKEKISEIMDELGTTCANWKLEKVGENEGVSRKFFAGYQCGGQ